MTLATLGSRRLVGPALDTRTAILVQGEQCGYCRMNTVDY